jgi:hypothetical protein
MVHNLRSQLRAFELLGLFQGFCPAPIDAVMLRPQLSGGYITVMAGGCMKWCWLFLAAAMRDW